MSREIQLDPGRTGLTLFALVFDAGGQIWNGSGLELPEDAHFSLYPVPLVEQGTTGLYFGDMPEVPAGFYTVSIRKQVGVSPALSGRAVYGAGTLEWDGTALVFPIPGPATSPNLCRVYGFEYLNGSPVAGRSVTAKLVDLPQANGSVILEGSDDATTTDADGFWHLDLVRGLSYSLRIVEAGIARTVEIPDQGSLDLRTVL